jgi:hypothetical protein
MGPGDKSDSGAEDATVVDRQLVEFARRVFMASVDRLPDITKRRLKQARERALGALDAAD